MELKHIVDIIYSQIFQKPEQRINDTDTTGKINKRPIKRTFISDYEIRKKYYNPETKEVTIPPNSIISPLSIEWIEYNMIKIKISE
jgi:hypothetical protein